MAKRETPPRPTPDELLVLACRPDYHGCFTGTTFCREDVLSAADLIRAGLVTMEESDDYGHRLMPTDRGWYRFYEMKLAEYQAKLNTPRPPVERIRGKDDPERTGPEIP